MRYTKVVFILLNILSTYINYTIARELIDPEKYQKLIDSVFPIFPTILTKIGPKVKVIKDIPPYLGWVTPTIYDHRIALCTTACLRKQIFIVSARCIIGKTPGVVSVHYESRVFLSLVILLPNREEASRHYHDDVGLIVTTPGTEFYRGTWPSIEVIQYNRTDDNFQWLSNLNWEKEIGKTKFHFYGFSRYAEKQKLPRLYHVGHAYVGLNFCEEVFKGSNNFKGYLKPCVNACHIKDKPKFDKHCQFMHINGAIIVDERNETHRIIGITTWTLRDTSEAEMRLPQGIAIPNSKNFWKDYTCAIEVVRELEMDSNPQPGYLKKICEN